VATLVVPDLDLTYPTLGPAIADFIEDRAIFGPGSLAGEPAKLTAEHRGILYRLYEVNPQGHRLQGRRRFQRGGYEVRKGLAKTELASWICYTELHPEAPVRCDGFDADGEPVGRPVKFPYIPMLAVTEGQASDLAYSVLKYVVEEGPDANLFDSSLDRILRKGPSGSADGKAQALANAPGARDGALTTFQHFDEPHRLILPSHKATHTTMDANLPKRPLEEPWSLYTSTAGQPGQGSVQEDLRAEAESIDRGEIETPKLFFFSRWAGDEHVDLTPRPATKTLPEVTPAEAFTNRVAAVADATGPTGEFGPGQFEDIASRWDRPKADHAYLERVWLNRWRRSGSVAFDFGKVSDLKRPGQLIPDGAFVTLGFDGARYKDSTGIVATDIRTGMQQLVGGWERPEGVEEWEVPEDEVTQTLDDVMTRFDVWKLYGDPPHWTETMGAWSVRHPDQIEEWWTARYKTMAYALRSYVEAIDGGSITYGGTDEQCDDLTRHLGNAGRQDLKILDDEGQPLWILHKQDGKQNLKFDFGMASVLSWVAYLEAIKTDAKPRRRKKRKPRRLY
jgi:hypothetical protein